MGPGILSSIGVGVWRKAAEAFPDSNTALDEFPVCDYRGRGGSIGRHLVGVWIGGVWNCHFPESEKFFSEAEISRKMPEIPQKERFLPNFRLRNLKIQSPKKCNSIPPAIPYPH